MLYIQNYLLPENIKTLLLHDNVSDGLLILIGGPVISDSTASRPQLEEDASTGGIGR